MRELRRCNNDRLDALVPDKVAPVGCGSVESEFSGLLRGARRRSSAEQLANWSQSCVEYRPHGLQGDRVSFAHIAGPNQSKSDLSHFPHQSKRRSYMSLFPQNHPNRYQVSVARPRIVERGGIARRINILFDDGKSVIVDLG
jgi:hypothetical protein